MLTWIFAVCLLNSHGECTDYMPMQGFNFSRLPLHIAKQECENMVRTNPGGRFGDSKNVCVLGYQTNYGYIYQGRM